MFCKVAKIPSGDRMLIMKQENKKWAYVAGGILLVILLVIIFVNIKNKRADRKITDFTGCVNAGNKSNDAYPRECVTKRGTIHKEFIGNEFEVKDLISITNPRPNQEITSPIVIEGLAKSEWFANNNFNIDLTDTEGTIVKSVKAYKMSGKDKDGFVKFRANLKFDLPSTLSGMLILNKNNITKDETLNNKLIVPVSFKQPEPAKEASTVIENTNPAGSPVGSEEPPVVNNKDEKVKISVFFNNKDNECDKVVAVEREITKVVGIGEASINELLTGPTATEKIDGYTTSINDGVSIKSIKKVGDTVNIDFNSKLGEGVAGSCKVGAITSQIKNTLTQFPTIKNVVLSIDGVSSEILQP